MEHAATGSFDVAKLSEAPSIGRYLSATVRMQTMASALAAFER